MSEDLAVNIAQAESQLVTLAKNPRSTASGLWQFLDSTAKIYCIDKYKIMFSLEEKDEPKKQTRCALSMLKEPGGWKHWSSSYQSWYNELDAL